MKKIYTTITSLFIMLTATTAFAQADFVYEFESGNWEGWLSQNSANAYHSVFANGTPGGALNVSWPNAVTTTKNIVLYAPDAVQTMSASTYKYVQVKLTNTSDEIDVMNIRARVAGGTWTVFHQESITTDTNGTVKTYDINVTNAGYTGTLDKFQIVFKNSANTVLTANTNTDAIQVHNIIISASSTLSTSNVSETDFNIYPNPVQNTLTVDAREAVNSIQVFDVLGKQVLTVQNTNSIDVSSLDKAIYFVQIHTESGSLTQKFIKE
jgi:hypothetical protein